MQMTFTNDQGHYVVREETGELIDDLIHNLVIPLLAKAGYSKDDLCAYMRGGL